MSNVTVVSADSRRLRKEFLRLPWKLYRDDANWVPPLRMMQRELVGYKRHPFYDDAQAQTFLALRGEEPVGRIAAIVNHGHNRRYDEQRGFFGFFESIDDQAVANALFDSARDWLRGQGMSAIRGPTNPSLNYECGLLVDGFDKPPTFMMTYNPPFYDELIEQAGLAKTQDMFAFWGHVGMLETMDQKVHEIADEVARRFQPTTRPLDTKRFFQDVSLFLHIYNESLGGTWGYVPMSEGEIRHMAKGLKMLIAPELTSVIAVEGKPIGACFGLLDYNPRIKKINGRLFPLGFLKLLTRRRQIKKIRILSANVLPEYQRWGLSLVLLRRIVPDILNWGVEEVEFSWVLESNNLSRKTLERGGAIREKTYRLYDGEL